MAGETTQGSNEAAAGQPADFQTGLDDLAERIRILRAPVDGDAWEYHDVGLGSSALEATAAAGKIAGSVYDGMTGTPTFSTAFEAASGYGNARVGNQDAANEHYVAAVANLTEDGLAGATVALHRAYEHVKEGEFVEALSEVADAAGDVVGTITSPAGRTIERVAEQVGQATELFSQGSKMYDNAAQDADYAQAVDNYTARRDSALASLEEQYAELVRVTEESGHEPRVESWYQARSDSAVAADALGLTPDYSAPEAGLTPLAPSRSMDEPLSPEQFSPDLPTDAPDPEPSLDDIALPPLGGLEDGGTSDTAMLEPTRIFGSVEADPGMTADGSLNADAVHLNSGEESVTADEPSVLEEFFGPQDFDLTDNFEGAGDVTQSLEEFGGSIASQLTDGEISEDAGFGPTGGLEPSELLSDTASGGSSDWVSPPGSNQYDPGGESALASSDLTSDDGLNVLEEHFGVQDFDLTDNFRQFEDLTQSGVPSENVATDGVGNSGASGSGADESNGDDIVSSGEAGGGDWSHDGGTVASDDSSVGDWGTSAHGNGPIADASDSVSSDYSAIDSTESDSGSSDTGGGSFDIDDSDGGDDPSSGTAV